MLPRTRKVDTVAIIPARGGSKRLPGKNLLPIGGKPLIEWTIDAALNSNVLDLIVVSSDDEAILALASRKGVRVVTRPAELARDDSPTSEALLHALKELECEHIFPQTVMLLQPSSPLRASDDIVKSLAVMVEEKCNSVISVCEVDHSPLWCNTLDESKCMDSFISTDIKNKRSQDLPVFYRLNGAIYIATTEIYKKEKSFFVENSRAYIMSRARSVDIDTADDLRFAEFVMQRFG
ncbi:acylneuraminate cytidylyltransferase family protein [Pseudomonas sp. PS1]|uniref:Acylneuraminate cytidylyltransferase family protein n=1 Tax=Stutzerimonas marianensis TaxID=2929513 RepID=A0A9X2AR12_9GAMM|nr:acylneuraminate cytidylyltransferase family protein [Pseudomonas marianensis]MCJ0972454.1 acylneuraminate cytidylyltransferase family protein [Pseudomonas marianensis]